MAEENLKQATKKGLYWSAASNVATQGMRFVFGIILARLLTPDAYGVIGMLTIFMCIVSTFIDCGFSQALITKQYRTQKDFSTEFWFNIVVGSIGYLILFTSSPFIADFYNMPILSPILKVIGIGVIINSLCVVQSAQFAIRLDFKTPAKIGVLIQMFTGVLGIILAYLGCGIWALVFQQVAGGLLNAICLWAIVRWKPTFEFSWVSFRYLWGYGSKVLGTSLIAQIYDNIQPLIIGKAFDARTLGLYSRGLNFASLPSVNLSNILGGVTFPILSKINNDIERLGNIYRKMIRITSLLVFPLMIGLSAVAEPLVKILLNEKWYECIPLLQLICFFLMFQPINYVNINLLKAAQRTDIMLKLEIIKKPLGLVLLLCAIPFGIKAFCVANILFYSVCMLLNTRFTSKVLNKNFFLLLYDMLPMIINALVMGGIVMVFIKFVSDNVYVQFLGGCAIGATTYLLTSYFFMKPTFMEFINFIKKKE